MNRSYSTYIIIVLAFIIVIASLALIMINIMNQKYESESQFCQDNDMEYIQIVSSAQRSICVDHQGISYEIYNNRNGKVLVK